MKEYRKLGFEEAADFIKNAGSALILCHTNPDGDTLGSAASLRDIILLLGGSAKIVAPSAIPARLGFIVEGQDTLLRDGDEERYDKLIAIDVASPSQLGDLSRLADRVDLMIDHHHSGEPFADNLIVPDASAAGEIVFDIYKLLIASEGILPDASICRSIFAAISSDTGSFKYSNTTPKTFRTAAELTEVINGADDGGLPTCDISRLLHDTVTEAEMKINAAVAERIKLYEDGALGVFAIDAETMASLGVSDVDLGGAIDIVRTLRGVLVAVTVRQRELGGTSFKLSSRASADSDVSAVCRRFGGGGHVRAAGASLHASDLDEALETVIPAFIESIREYRLSAGDTAL